MQFLFPDGTMEGIYLKHVRNHQTSTAATGSASNSGPSHLCRHGLDSEREMVGMIIMMIHG